MQIAQSSRNLRVESLSHRLYICLSSAAFNGFLFPMDLFQHRLKLLVFNTYKKPAATVPVLLMVLHSLLALFSSWLGLLYPSWCAEV